MKITGINIIDNEPGQNGLQLLAEFAIETNDGMLIQKMKLLRTDKGGFVAVPPGVSNDAGDRQRVLEFKTPKIRHSIMEAARKIYIQMGGMNGEYCAYHLRHQPPNPNNNLETKYVERHA